MSPKKGKNSPYFKDKTGEKHITNEGYEIEIVEYFGAFDCTIVFSDVYKAVLYNVHYSNIKIGQVRNPYHPALYGIGYYGQGKYEHYKDKTPTICCRRWRSLIERSGSIKLKEIYTTYKDVTVCEEWKCFQNFAEWFEKNYIDGWDLDKDILVKGNKVYSPETCCFIPHEVNSMIVKSDKNRGECPIGVRKIYNRFQARINKGDQLINLGRFDKKEEAFRAYKIAKEDYIKEVADKYKHQLPEKVYEALYNYQVEITD